MLLCISYMYIYIIFNLFIWIYIYIFISCIYIYIYMQRILLWSEWSWMMASDPPEFLGGLVHAEALQVISAQFGSFQDVLVEGWANKNPVTCWQVFMSRRSLFQMMNSDEFCWFWGCNRGGKWRLVMGSSSLSQMWSSKFSGSISR